MDLINIATSYCVHALSLLDKRILAKQDVIQAFKNKDRKTIERIKIQFKLETNDDLNKFILEIFKFFGNIKSDMKSRFNQMDKQELIAIINKKEATDEFCKKYILSKEENKNDKLF